MPEGGLDRGQQGIAEEADGQQAKNDAAAGVGGERLQGALAAGRPAGGGGGAGRAQGQASGEVADQQVDDRAGQESGAGYPVDPAAVGRLLGGILGLVAQVPVVLVGPCVAHRPQDGPADPPENLSGLALGLAELDGVGEELV